MISTNNDSSTPVPSKGVAILFVALSGLLYGTLCLFGIWMLERNFEIFPMLFWRFATAAVFTLAIGYKKFGSPHDIFVPMTLGSLLLGALLYGIASSLLFFASEAIGTGLSMVVFYSFPIFVFLWIWLVRKEPVTVASWLSLGAVCVGILFLNDDAEIPNFDSFGIVLALIASAAYALYIIFSEKQANHLNPWLSTFVLCVVSSVYFLTLSIARGEMNWPTDTYTWVVAIALGIFSTALPVLLMLIGLKNVRADLASILSVFEPLGTLVLGVIFLHEALSGSQMVGIVVVLLGAISTTLSMSKKPAEASSSSDTLSKPLTTTSASPTS